MKTQLKKPVLYVMVALLSIPLIIGIGYLTVNAVTEVLHKRRLVNGVQIIATVTDRESHFNVVRGGGATSYGIDYEFQYTDRQTGRIQKQVHVDYPVYKKEYATYTPGSTFTTSFIPSDPQVNEPAAAVGRLSPQSVLLARLMTGLIFLGVVTVLVWKVSGKFERFQYSRKLGIAAVVLTVVFVVGLITGRNVAQLVEYTLL